MFLVQKFDSDATTLRMVIAIYICAVFNTFNLMTILKTDLATHWDWVTHIWVSKLTSISSDISLSRGRCQANIWTNARILLIGSLRTKFSEISSEIHTFSFKKMHFKIRSGRGRPFCLGPNMLKYTLIALVALVPSFLTDKLCLWKHCKEIL